jgi:hypothetical protein
MKLAIMQPYFYPYIGYFQMIYAVNKFIFYDDVQFIERGWINRNYLLSKEGRQLFTIPLKQYSLGDSINIIEVAGNSNWKDSLLKTIYLTYKRAPNFEIIYNIIDSTLKIETSIISDYCIASIISVYNYLKINREFISSSEINYNRTASKTEKIISILESEKASELILPPGSIDLYSKEQFNVPAYFIIPSDDISYKQFSKTRFEKNLSIIDILMFCDLEIIFKLLNFYSLK